MVNDLFMSVSGREYTYEQLFRDLNDWKDCRCYVHVQGNNPYTIVVRILHSMIHNYNIELLDGALPDIEYYKKGVLCEEVLNVRSGSQFMPIHSLGSIIPPSHPDWHLTLHTSGTTGKPKKIAHGWDSLTRGTKISAKHAQDVWILTYNPTHIAGLQVIFQAVCNHNPIIYAESNAYPHLGLLIDKYKVTHISATPTYYRNALPFLHTSYPSVRSAASGGEKFDGSLERPMQRVFPNARLLNLYATTESGSLLVGSGEYLTVPSDIKPYIRISQEGELLIHRKLLGQNSGTSFDGEGWYPSGDLVQQLGDGRLLFISRRSDFINVGGYKVNPEEVERIMLQVAGVVDVSVKAMANHITGEMVVADVVKEPASDPVALKREIKSYVSRHLQSYKVPRLIHYVERLQTTRTGKKLRR